MTYNLAIIGKTQRVENIIVVDGDTVADAVKVGKELQENNAFGDILEVCVVEGEKVYLGDYFVDGRYISADDYVNEYFAVLNDDDYCTDVIEVLKGHEPNDNEIQLGNIGEYVTIDHYKQGFVGRYFDGDMWDFTTGNESDE